VKGKKKRNMQEIEIGLKKKKMCCEISLIQLRIDEIKKNSYLFFEIFDEY